MPLAFQSRPGTLYTASLEVVIGTVATPAALSGATTATLSASATFGTAPSYAAAKFIGAAALGNADCPWVRKTFELEAWDPAAAGDTAVAHVGSYVRGAYRHPPPTTAPIGSGCRGLDPSIPTSTRHRTPRPPTPTPLPSFHRPTLDRPPPLSPPRIPEGFWFCPTFSPLT